MHNLTPPQVHELLLLLSDGLKAYLNGDATVQAEALIKWVKLNAPEYLK